MTRCSNSSFVIILLLIIVFSLQVYNSTRISVRLDIRNNWQQSSYFVARNQAAEASDLLSPSGEIQHITLNTTSPSIPAPCYHVPRTQSLSSFFTTNYTSEKFTIVVPTYKRNYCIYSSLRHYCKMQHVAKIIVLWNNLGEAIPRYLKKIRCKAELKYMPMRENRMTTRYILFPDIQTEGIVDTLNA